MADVEALDEGFDFVAACAGADGDGDGGGGGADEVEDAWEGLKQAVVEGVLDGGALQGTEVFEEFGGEGAVVFFADHSEAGAVVEADVAAGPDAVDGGVAEGHAEGFDGGFEAGLVHGFGVDDDAVEVEDDGFGGHGGSV